MVTSVYVPFRPVSPIKTFKFATFGCSHALLPWKLNRYSCRVLFGINCTALDQSELSNFVECTWFGLQHMLKILVSFIVFYYRFILIRINLNSQLYVHEYWKLFILLCSQCSVFSKLIEVFWLQVSHCEDAIHNLKQRLSDKTKEVSVFTERLFLRLNRGITVL